MPTDFGEMSRINTCVSLSQKMLLLVVVDIESESLTVGKVVELQVVAYWYSGSSTNGVAREASFKVPYFPFNAVWFRSTSSRSKSDHNH